MAEEEEQRRLDQMDEDQLKALEEGMAAMVRVYIYCRHFVRMHMCLVVL